MKKLWMPLSALLVILGLCAAAAGEDQGALSAYDPVLDRIAAGLMGDEAVQQAEDFNISMLQNAVTAGLDPMRAVGLLYEDLDGDGAPELILGQTESEFPDRFLYAIWTLADGKPSLAAEGWERNRLYLTYDFSAGRYGLYSEGSDSAFQSQWRTGEFRGGRAVWRHTLQYDSEAGEAWTLDGAAIEEEEALSLSEEWRESLVDPELFYLTAREEAKAAYGAAGDFPDLPPFSGDPDEDGAPQEADTAFVFSDRVRQDAPLLTIEIRDTGEFTGAAEEPSLVLRVSVTAEDGTLLQSFTYPSMETPEGMAGSPQNRMARFSDMNFDGYGDLVLLTAMGAYNEFVVFCLWNPEAGRFDPVMTACPWNFEKEAFDYEAEPLELCGFLRLPGRDGMPDRLLSTVRDGYAYTKLCVYEWEAPDFPVLLAAFQVYSAQGGKIGDRAYRFASQGEKLWEHVYPEDWYAGRADPGGARREAFLEWLSGAERTAKVANTNWVNLRERDTTRSKSLSKLKAGAEVEVLKKNISPGWDLVLWDTGKPDEAFLGNRREIGYIQNRFLTK